jgi:hypothetical protein
MYAYRFNKFVAEAESPDCPIFTAAIIILKKIIGYIREFIHLQDKRILGFTILFMSLFIFCNYHFSLNARIGHLADSYQYTYWFIVFTAAFGFPYLLYFFRGITFPKKSAFPLLFLIAPILFSWKMVYDIEFSFPVAPDQNLFWNQVIYWPLKLVAMSAALWMVWKATRDPQPFYGTDTRGLQWRPYLLMLLIMVPLIALASTQPDFLKMYPKLKNLSYLGSASSPFNKILYELSYGTDFITIELFFRGFLVLAFVRWFGMKAILPMACFYCTIHFGKPMGECISSFFGGTLLGIVTYNTRTIAGGLLVHLGIAWLMELGGYIGNSM